MKNKTFWFALLGLWLLAAALGLWLALPGAALAQAEPPAIIYLFWGDGCPHCEIAKPPVRELAQRYSVELREYEVWNNPENQALFVSMAQAFKFEPRYVPTIFMADRYWEGFNDNILAEMEAVAAACLHSACPDAGAGLAAPASSEPASPAGVNPPAAAAQVQHDGFTVAVLTMFGMAAALVYTGVSVRRGLTRRKRVRGQPLQDDGWRTVGVLVLSLAGLGVASYLAYVETQAVPAVCGPVGDCNAVQSSPYAKLFGLLPVGVLGVVGYLAILAAWFYPRLRSDRYSAYMPVVVFGMAFLGVLFSLYLTYLEPFVIKAVCMWCISSAVIMTLLLLITVQPAVQALQTLKGARLTHAKT